MRDVLLCLLVFGQLGFKVIKQLPTTLCRAINAIKLGMTIRPLKRSAQCPHQINLERGADNDESADNHAIGKERFFREEEAHVLFGKKVPADDR